MIVMTSIAPCNVPVVDIFSSGQIYWPYHNMIIRDMCFIDTLDKGGRKCKSPTTRLVQQGFRFYANRLVLASSTGIGSSRIIVDLVGVLLHKLFGVVCLTLSARGGLIPSEHMQIVERALTRTCRNPLAHDHVLLEAVEEVLLRTNGSR